MSTIFSRNFSFQALNLAYISSIWAGDGFSPFPGCPDWPRWIHRYFCVGMMPPLLGCVGQLKLTPNDVWALSFWTLRGVVFGTPAMFSGVIVTRLRQQHQRRG